LSKLMDSLNDWIRSFQSGKAWFNKLESEQTKRVYLTYLKKFCDAVQKNPDELVELKLEGLKNIGTAKEFQMEILLEDFLENPRDYFEKVKHLHKDYANYAKEGLTNASKVNVKSAVLSFFKHNRRRLEFCAEKWRPQEARERCPTIEDVQALAENCKVKRDKAIVWFLASAPFREQTLVKLNWSDLQPTEDKDIPIKIVVESARLKGKGKGRYRGLKQISFLHWFAYQKLMSYKKELQRELEKEGEALSEDMALFVSYRKNGKDKFSALSKQRLRDIFEDASLSAWGNLEEKRFSPHNLRDFVNTALINAGVVGEPKSCILGHKIKGVDKHYTDVGQLRLLEKLKKAIPYLIPEHKLSKPDFEYQPVVSQIKRETQELSEKLETIIPIIGDLAEKLLENPDKQLARADVQHMKDKVLALKKALKPRDQQNT
jgi:integrase